MIDLITNPWFISLLVVVFILGNLASLKFLGHNNLIRPPQKKKSDLDKLLEIYRAKEKDAQSLDKNEHLNNINLKDQEKKNL